MAGVSSSPIGTFRSRTHRDGEALRRDGESVYSARMLDEENVEVLFDDGLWMLVAPGEVDPA